MSKVEAADLERLVSHLQLRRFQPGQTIFKQGAPSDAWFLLLHGSADVAIDQEEGPPRTVATIHAVSAFGERGILWDCPRTASLLCASEECICAALPTPIFFECLPKKVIKLLKSAMPPPEGHAKAHPEGGVAATGDAPPLQTDEHKKYKLRQLTFLGVLGKGSFGTVRLVQHKEAGQDGTARLMALKCRA